MYREAGMCCHVYFNLKYPDQHSQNTIVQFIIESLAGPRNEAKYTQCMLEYQLLFGLLQIMEEIEVVVTYSLSIWIQLPSL